MDLAPHRFETLDLRKRGPNLQGQLPGAFRDLAHQTERFLPKRLNRPVLPPDRFEPGAGNSRSAFSGRPIGLGIRIDCCQRTAISELIRASVEENGKIASAIRPIPWVTCSIFLTRWKTRHSGDFFISDSG